MSSAVPVISAERATSVFVVEDEGLIAMEISDRLTQLGYDVQGSAARGEDALQSIRQKPPDLVLMDIRLSGKMSGIETAAKLRESHDIPVVYLTAYSDEELLREAARTEPYGYLLKPFDQRELHATIKMAVNKSRADSRLRQTEALFRSAVELWDEAVAILDADGRVLAANAAFSNTFGHSSIVAELPRTAQPDVLAALAEAAGGTASTAICESNRDSESRRVELQLHPIAGAARSSERNGRVLCLSRHLGEKSQGSHELGAAQAENLAVELSHHFNNLLNIIVGNAELANRHLPKPPPGHPAESSATKILHAASDAESLLQRLLESSGKAPMARQPNRLGAVLDEALREVAPLVPARCKIECKIDPECPAVTGDPGQLRRVLVELLANACQALRGEAGHVRIELRESSDHHSMPDATPDRRYAALSVSDDGVGMAKQTVDRIFEPFFTMRTPGSVFSANAVGQGIGLGLAVVRGVIDAHEGFVNVRSQAGQGCEFTIYLPLVDQP